MIMIMIMIIYIYIYRQGQHRRHPGDQLGGPRVRAPDCAGLLYDMLLHHDVYI